MANHKTVILLDHCNAMQDSSGEPIEFDIFSKSKSLSMIPLNPITKTTWTCCLESAIEYARIVFDLFTGVKSLQLLVSDSKPHALNTWQPSQQNMATLTSNLATLNLKKTKKKPSEEMQNLLDALTQAVENLTEATGGTAQQKKDHSKPRNEVRIICLTQLQKEAQVKVLQECLKDALSVLNRKANSSPNSIPITKLVLSILQLCPVGHQSQIAHSSLTEITPILSTEIFVSQSGHHIADKLVSLSVSNYNLAITTVTGIPMKEEQNASSSANYDVELLHERAAHHSLYGSGGLILKWCTPKSSAIELHPCTGSYRVCPVEVNSRPSSCLTNFLLNGRAVMLEMSDRRHSRSSPNTTHMLTSHAGQIYIQVLMSGRSILDDPPSISEGCGGRVTDYRINDFGELMQRNKLMPVTGLKWDDHGPINCALSQIERSTRHWPLTIGETLLHGLGAQMEPLLSLVPQDVLNDVQVSQCKKVIFQLVSQEQKGQVLPTARGRKEDQYKQLWGELEAFLRLHAANSSDHQRVLDTLTANRPSNKGAVQAPVESIPHESLQPLILNKTPNSFTKCKKVEQEVEPEPKRLRIILKAAGAPSVLDMWTGKGPIQGQKKTLEFTGRSEGSKYQLYKEPISETSSTSIQPLMPLMFKKRGEIT